MVESTTLTRHAVMAETGTQVPVRAWLFPLVFAGMVGVGVLFGHPRTGDFNSSVSVLWSLYLPIATIGALGVLASRHPGGKVEISTFDGVIDDPVVIVVPTLCRGGNLPALRRVIGSVLEHAPRNLHSFRIDVVVDEGDADVTAATAELLSWLGGDAQVRVLVVPRGYRTPKGARYKTRANQYAADVRRAQRENTSRHYVYHLDDDTGVRADTIASIAEFIDTNRRGEHLLAQGILAFPNELTPSTFANLADSVRPGDDASRFCFFTGVLGTPLGGLHGEHLLIRADVEDEIGWDFPDTVIEDSQFALHFARKYPRRATTLKSFSYGSSPAGVADLVRQRRRWAEGLLRLTFKRGLPIRTRIPLGYTVLCWATAPLQFVGLVVSVGLLAAGRASAPDTTWIGIVWSFSLAFLVWQYLLGFRINNRASARPRPAWHAVAVIPMLVIFSAVESLGAALGVLRFLGILQRQTASEVIAKPV